MVRRPARRANRAAETPAGRILEIIKLKIIIRMILLKISYIALWYFISLKHQYPLHDASLIYFCSYKFIAIMNTDSAESIEAPPPVNDERVFFNLLAKVGTIGKYQTITVVFWSIASYLCGGLMFIVPFLLYQDPYDCGDLITSNCKETICAMDPADRLQYIPTTARMYTLGNEFGDFRCPAEKVSLDLVASLMYFGGVIGYLALAAVGQILGRKQLMVASIAFTFVGLVIASLAQNLIMAGVGLFIAAFGIQDAFTIAFYFLAETIAESHRDKYSVLIQLFFGLGVVLNTAFYYFIGNWKIIFWIFYVLPAGAVLVGIIFLVKESPLFLVTKYSAEVAYKDFMAIAKLNGIKDPQLTVSDIQKVKETYQEDKKKKNQKNFTVIDLFKYPSLRWMTVMTVALMCFLAFLFYAPALMLDQFQLDIFIDGLAIGFSQFISYPCVYFVISKLRRKLSGYICFGMALICSIALLFVGGSGDCEGGCPISESIGQVVLIFVFRYFISFHYTVFMVYFNELFPTQVRAVGTSLASLFGGLASTVAPQVIDLFTSINAPIMILFIAAAVLSLFISYKLPETYMKAPPDIIQELRNKEGDIQNPEQSMIEPDFIKSDSLEQPLMKPKGISGKTTNYTASEDSIPGDY